MEEKKQEERLIARINVTAKVEYLPPVIDFVGDVSRKLGLGAKDSKKMELVIEEAGLNVITHAFEPDEEGDFDVIIFRKPGQVVVAVEDRGMPFDFKKFEKKEDSGLGALLMRAFADEIHFVNLGHAGKRLEFVKNLTYKNIEDYFPEEEKTEVETKPVKLKDEDIEIRFMDPEDAVQMARCIYHSYGYSYGWDFVYFPERVKEFLQSRLLRSCITLNPEKEIIGHFAMVLDKINSRVGETGMAVVDPKYRGNGLFKKMKRFVISYAAKKEMYGIYSEAVAVHPFSQKGNISIGAHETGILFGHTPSTIFFKKIQKQKKSKRQSAILYYLKINDGEKLDIYPPFHHFHMISKIYEENELKRNIIKSGKKGKQIKLSGSSQVNVNVKSETLRAYMQIVEYGEDIEELISYRLRELCMRRIDCIYLDLPLSNPFSQKFCASFEMLGFFFAGIIPELYDCDVLRLQYLNNVEIDFNQITVVSEFGHELFDYILKAYKKEYEIS